MPLAWCTKQNQNNPEKYQLYFSSLVQFDCITYTCVRYHNGMIAFFFTTIIKWLNPENKE